MRIPWLAFLGPGLLFGPAVEGAPGSHHKRKPYDPNDPGTSTSQIMPIGYNYGYIPSADPTSQSTSKTWNPPATSYVPSCSDWVLCYTCPGGYYCPSTETTASPTQSLVIVPTCSSWKACPECRGGYKCWPPKPTYTQAPAQTTSVGLTVIPTCYPWIYCYSCVGGYSCPRDPGPTTSTITKAPKPIVYATPSPTFSVTKGPGVSRSTQYLPTCSSPEPCPTCLWGWSCPVSDPADQTYTVIITQGTYYTTTTETLPASYGGYGYGTYGTSQPPEATLVYDWASYDQPTCPDYIVCPTCALGYYCPSIPPVPSTPAYYQPQNQSPSSISTASLSPSFYPPPCDNYVICQDCFLGYYCPEPSQGVSTTVKDPVKLYGSPPCDDYIVCPTCNLGYYCPPSLSSGPSSNPITVPSYGTPTCSDYLVCPSCPLGYYCPSPPTTSTRPVYNTKSSGDKYNSNSRDPQTPSTTYYIGLPTTTIVVAPTCSEYVLCPVCPGNYYCPSVSPRPVMSKSTPYSYTDPNASEPPTATIPSCDAYVFCPECELGYSCLYRSASSTKKGLKPYKTEGNPNPPISNVANPYPASTPKSRDPTIDGVYVTAPRNLGYGPTSVSAPGLPTCASYVLCPACPLGYYCISTVATTVAASTYYGVAPTGVVEPVYSTSIVSSPSISPPKCPKPVRTVTMTKTRDIYRIYNICAPDPYAILTSFIIPTATISRCDSKPLPSYTKPTSTSSSNCSTCDPGNSFYPVARPTNFSPLSFTNWGQGRPYSQNTAG
ncbi:hypothetical protein TWF718_004167 [Orbilia javanica]|uniref:Uncharacterized protein n=1 Tax=Orbilia javanica TaxID=47235 RepID=A0AAN8MUM2_9PEZI